MKLFFVLTKRKLAVIFCSMIFIFVGFIWTSSLKVSAIDGSTHAKRMEYIRYLKVDVDEDNYTFKETVIPEKFSDVYKGYNKLQRLGGFDLSNYKGEKVTVYSYPLTASERILTLIIHDGEIIGGDIAEIKIDGKMTEIRKY